MLASLTRGLSAFLGNSQALTAHLIAEQEIYSRPMRIRSLPALLLPDKFSDLPDRHWFPQGAALSISSLQGGAAAIQKAVESEDPSLFATALGDVKNQPRPKFKPPTAIDYIRYFREIPVIAELRYKDKSLATWVFVSSEIPVRIEIMPYNGGEIDTTNFKIIEYYLEEDSAPLDSVMILSPPTLTDVEKTALEKMPPSHTEMNIIGTAGGGTFWCFHTHDGFQGHDLIDQHDAGPIGIIGDRDHLSLDTAQPTVLEVLNNLGPVPSASDLLKARRELLRRASSL